MTNGTNKIGMSYVRMVENNKNVKRNEYNIKAKEEEVQMNVISQDDEVQIGEAKISEIKKSNVDNVKSNFELEMERKLQDLTITVRNNNEKMKASLKQTREDLTQMIEEKEQLFHKQYENIIGTIREGQQEANMHAELRLQKLIKMFNPSEEQNKKAPSAVETKVVSCRGVKG